MKMYHRVSSISIQLPEDPVEPAKSRSCTGCGISLELSSKNFHKDPYRRNGFDIYCRSCRSKMKKIYGNRIKEHNKGVSNA